MGPGKGAACHAKTSTTCALSSPSRAASFTRAAAGLGVSQSALSHTIRQLEKRLGLRLLTSTTRAVAPTEAGRRLLEGIAPHLEQIDQQVEALGALRDTPAGTVRIVSSEYAISHVIWPRIPALVTRYPEIRLDVILDNGLTDIVTEGSMRGCAGASIWPVT